MTWSAGTVTSSAWPLKRVAAITRSPSPSPSTPSPIDSTSPATSYPSTHGTFGASGYIPIRAIVSAKLIPAARTAIRISPAPTVGSGRSCTRSTSGGPTLVSTTARMAPPYPGSAGLEVHRTARVKTVELEDLLEELVRHGSVGRQRQHRLAARRLRSDGRRTDVHSVGAEDRPDPADHARLILVAEHHEMIGEWHVEALAPNLHQMRKAPRTHGGSRNIDRSVPRLGRRGPEVRGHHDVVAPEHRMVSEGLRREDVERGAGHLAGVQSRLDRLQVDQLAPRAVDDAHAVLHARDRLVVDPVHRVRGLRQVDRHDVGLRVELIRGLCVLDSELAKSLRGDELVEGDHVHLERLGALRHQLADAPEPDHAERLAVELVAGELRPRPLPLREGGVGPRDVAAERERERERVLRGGDRVRLRRVHDHDATFGRGVHVDVVDTRPGAADHLQ